LECEGDEPGQPSFEALRQARLDAEPLLHVSGEAVVMAAHGVAIEWMPDAIGASFPSLFDEAETVAACVEARMMALDELSLTLHDGRRVAATATPCADGWLVRLQDVTGLRVLAEAVAQRERLEALEGLASALARELNDPMSIVQGRLELLLELGVSDAGAVAHHQRVALEHARRISATLRNLRLVGSSSSRRLQHVPLAEVVDEALAFLGPRGERVVVAIEPADLAVGGLRAMYARVLANTLRQTVEGSARGPVHLKAKRRGQKVVVTVDMGRRGRSEDLEGADLSIDRTLLRAVGGQMVARRVGGAPTFELTLPLPPAIRGRARPVDSTLLVVGSDHFADHVQTLLAKDGFQFRWAGSGEEALEALVDPPDAVLAELILPGAVSGLSLGKQLTTLHEELRGRVVVVADGPIRDLPHPLQTVWRPLSRARILDALGRRVRRS
jgi:hypothetical protein